MSVLVRSLIPGATVQLLLPSQYLFMTKKRMNHNTDRLGNQAEKKKKKKDKESITYVASCSWIIDIHGYDAYPWK